jgi:hypothetical protein|nr:MAG TPA: hypothetical protein [Caudoviricetes sp.]
MEKFVLSTRRSLAIVSYIAASMGYSKEEIKFITAGMLKQNGEVNEFHKILTEPLDKIVRVEHKGEVKDLVEPFNLVERIQMVIELIINKSTVTESVNLKPTASVYQYSPFKFSNFIKKPEDKPKLVNEEEYLSDEALIKKFGEKRLEAIIKERVEKELQKRENLEKERLDEERRKEMFEETMARINGSARFSKHENVYNRQFYSRPFSQGNRQTRPDFTPGFNPFSSKHIVNEIDEINQVIDNLIGFRDRLIAKLGYDQFKEKEQPKEPQEPKEQPNINWDNVQKAQESPAAFEPVKFTEEQRQHQREILGNQFDFKSRYDKIANEKVGKLSEYSIRHSTQHLFDTALRNRTEEEAMISRSIEIYPSTNLCKDSLNTGNFKNPSDFKGLFSFVRVDGDRLYRINDSSVQPWNRSKPLGTIRMISENFGLFTSTKITIKVNEDAVEEYVDEYFDNPYVILDAVNSKYGYSIAPEDIDVNQVLGTPNLRETPSQYLFRHSYYRVADEVKASLKESRNKLIKGLVRDSAIVVLNDKELYDWIKGENPTNS